MEPSFYFFFQTDILLKLQNDNLTKGNDKMLKVMKWNEIKARIQSSCMPMNESIVKVQREVPETNMNL